MGSRRAETNYKTKFNSIMFQGGKGKCSKALEISRVTPVQSAALASFAKELFHDTSYDIRDVSYAEFVRAKWMWTRKPKSFLGDGPSILVFIGLVLLLVPYAGIMLALVWCFAMLLVVAKDAVRLIRWRYEYESSIARVVRSRRKAK